MTSGGGGEKEGNGRVVEGALFGAGEVEDGRMTKDVVRTVVTFHPEEDVGLKQPVGEEGRRGEERERKKKEKEGKGRERKEVEREKKGRERRGEEEEERGGREVERKREGRGECCSHYE